MDVVEYLLEQRKRSYEILKKNGIKQEVVTGYCPQCQQTKQEIEYEQQLINPTVPEKLPELDTEPQQEVLHTYNENEVVESESENEVIENITEIEQQTENISVINQNIQEQNEQESCTEDNQQQDPSLPLFL